MRRHHRFYGPNRRRQRHKNWPPTFQALRSISRFMIFVVGWACFILFCCPALGVWSRCGRVCWLLAGWGWWCKFTDPRSSLQLTQSAVTRGYTNHNQLLFVSQFLRAHNSILAPTVKAPGKFSASHRHSVPLILPLRLLITLFHFFIAIIKRFTDCTNEPSWIQGMEWRSGEESGSAICGKQSHFSHKAIPFHPPPFPPKVSDWMWVIPAHPFTIEIQLAGLLLFHYNIFFFSFYFESYTSTTPVRSSVLCPRLWLSSKENPHQIQLLFLWYTTHSILYRFIPYSVPGVWIQFEGI